MKHFELILAAALCGSLFAGAALNAADEKPAKATGKKAEKKTEVVWLTDFEAAKKQAAAEKKPILMFFTGSDWCGWCQKLHEDVLDKDEFQKFAKENVILLELDFPNSIPQSDKLKKQNKELGEKFDVNGYPTMVLVASDGETEIDRTVGYSKELVGKLKDAVKGGSATKKAVKTPAKKANDPWLTDFEVAKKQAAAEKKPILMFFTGSDWCGWCQKLHTDVLDKSDFKNFAKDNVILLELDFPNSIPQSAELKKQNKALGEKFKVDGYPTMVLVAPNGETELDRTVGYDKDLVKKLKKALKKDSADAKKKSGEKASDEDRGEGVAWLTDFEAAKKQAAEEKKPILMFFTGSDWCIWCQRLHEDVLDEDEFGDFSKKLVLLELDFPQEKELPEAQKKQNAELSERFGVDGYPCTVVLEPDGKTELGRLSGYSKDYIERIQDILDGNARPVTMDELKEKFSYLPDVIMEYNGTKVTREDIIREIADEVLPLRISLADCDAITPEKIGEIVVQKLDQAILLDMAEKSGFKPSAKLVKDAVSKEIDEFPAEQKEALEKALKEQGSSIDKLVDELADDKDRQEITAIKLFVNKRAEDAAKKEIDEEALKDHYEVNRAQYPGSFEAERERVMNTLVRIKAASKADELDKEVEAVRKTVKYWQPEK